MNTMAATNPDNTFSGLSFCKRFHVRLTALYGGTVIITLAAMAAVFYQLSVQSEMDALRQRLLVVVTSLAQSIDAGAIANIALDTERMTTLHTTYIEKFRQVAESDPHIDSIYILRPTSEPKKLRFFIDYAKHKEIGLPGEVYYAGDVPTLLQGFEGTLVEESPVADKYGLSISGYAPLIDDIGNTIGLVGVDVMVHRLTSLKQRVLTTTLVLFTIAAMLVVLISLFVARSIRKPLRTMIAATSAIATGRLDTHVGFQRKDEFGVLGNHFDRMTKELKERQLIKDTFGRYVSEDVVKALLRNGQIPSLGGEERVVTVLFSDLRDYTSISEQLSPVQTVNILNQYFGAMNAIIDKHKGCVIEFMGDGILAVFGALETHSDHAEQAIRCALEMRERLRELNQAWEENNLAKYWQKAGVKKLEARVGIHTGLVVAGNLGSPTRMKYAVIGDSVNVAARIEGLNKELNSSILISDEVLPYLSLELASQTRDKGMFEVKGRQKSIRIYSL